MSQSIHRLLDACQTIVAAIERATQNHHGPILIAIDGGSGAGKSTLAAQLERQIDAVVVPLDDFFAAHIPDWEWDTRDLVVSE
jgi:uridine kinase